MAYSKIEKKAIELAEPIAAEYGCSIYDAEYVREGGIYFLRIFADRDGGIDLDTCEAVSRALSDALDREDPIAQNYYLEVSSPGIERRLKTEEHFKRYIGEEIDISLYRAIDGSKQLCGVLTDFRDGKIFVSVNGNSLEIPKKEAAQVRLHYDFKNDLT
ncbi:MAG: ribosome maturation factor RimP [Monoglobaceae bacterium]